MFDFGQRLVRLRKEHGLSQKELAQKIQVSKSTLANYENDMGFPSLSVAEDMADVFNVSLDYLACGEKAKIITARNLKDDQIQLITELIQEMASPGASGYRLSVQQQDLIARIIEQFLK